MIPQENEAPAWAPPREFDEYRLVRFLGRGAMGQVFVAHDTLLDREVAIKFLASARSGTLARDRFLVEARAIARLQHPNVVAVFRAGEVAGRPYLVSELLRGQSLERARKPMAPREVQRIALGLSRGLAAAHRRGVLHRDIKPANVMHLDGGEVKLLDFGLAKLLSATAVEASVGGPPRAGQAAPPDEEGALDETLAPDETVPPARPAPGPMPAGDGPMASPALTQAGAILGTPLYMAPEVWRGEPATERSDLYSLGALLFELACGEPPHREATMADLGRAVTERDAPSLGEQAPGLPARLAEVIARCLMRDPAARPRSAEELARTLEEIEIETASRGAMPEGNPYRGLHAFEAEHRSLFFGRDAEIRALIDLMRAEPVVLLAGDSGVGKSSLCRAGVLPLLCEGALGEERRWRAVSLLPGRRPLSALCDALPRDLGESAALLALFTEEPAAEAGRALRQRLGDGQGLIVFVDQLEELITQSDEEEAAAFVQIVSQLGARMPGVRVLLTTRGDALTRLAALPGMDRGLFRAVHVLRPLRAEELREAILGPARKSGVAFEREEQVEELLSEAAAAEGGLPLLQFTLAELWDKRDAARRIIPAAALPSIGGVAGALSRHADAVLSALLPGEREAARRILTRLVTAGGARVRRGAAELSAGADDESALEALTRGRLLFVREVEGQPAYEVAHEALVNGWATLRRWLDEDHDRRAVRERLEAAAAEWQRLGRTRDLLWGERQLLEVTRARLGPGEIGAHERAFVQASRRGVRQRKAARLGLLIGAPLMVALAYGGFALQARYEVRRAVAARLGSAQAILMDAREKNRAVERARAAAFALFDSGDRDGGEREWARARALVEEAQAAYALASSTLDDALQLDARDRAVRGLLAALLYERALLAERDHQREQRAQLLDWLDRLDTDGAFKARLHERARLYLRLEEGASATLARYENEGGLRRLSRPVALDPGVPAHEVAPGSYLITLRAPGRVEVRYPILIGRGERHEVRLALPPAGAVPEGFIYVPPGRFLYGSTMEDGLRRDVFKVPPLHAVTGHAYLISRTEVTFAQWIEFLRALPPAERRRRMPLASGARGGLSGTRGALSLAEGPDGVFVLSFMPTDRVYSARQGEPIVYPGRTRRTRQDWLRFPVSGISFEDAEAYAAWLARSGRVPGARLCSEMEWERAARGADDRIYPHGDILAADDANHDRTYGRHPSAFGPDEVGAHPASESPFGAADMAGNVWEWARSLRGEVLLIGGSWYQEALVSAATNREFGEPTLRGILNGLRLCADPQSPTGQPRQRR